MEKFTAAWMQARACRSMSLLQRRSNAVVRATGLDPDVGLGSSTTAVVQPFHGTRCSRLSRAVRSWIASAGRKRQHGICQSSTPGALPLGYSDMA
eukprot:1245983-Amphidinium_carterae.1